MSSLAGYRIAPKCFYAFLFRRPRGEKYRNNSVWKLDWAFLRKGRDATTRLSQRRARGPIRRQLAVRCAAQQQVRFNAHPVSLQNIATTVCGSLAWTAQDGSDGTSMNGKHSGDPSSARVDTTAQRLSQRRARGPIRRQLAVRCAAQKQVPSTHIL